MSASSYAMIIIGAGMSGLSTGLAWLKTYGTSRGPVLILEKQPVVGGCVASFAREGYRFDTVQIIPDVSDILEYFGLEIKLRKFDNYYARLFLADPVKGTADIFPIAADLTDFAENLSRHYPEDQKAIRRFFQYCRAMHAELQHLKTEPRFHELPAILWRCKRILVNSGRTYAQFLKGFHFKNTQVYEILDIFSSFSGLSGDRCAALLTACAMITTLKGSYRPLKSFIQFPNELKKAYLKRGGELLLNSQVEQILTKDGKASGVRLSDGRVIPSEIVVSTADTQVTFGRLLGYEQLDQANHRYAQKARQAQMSPSAFAIHLGLDQKIDLKALGYDCGYNVLTTGHQAHTRMFQAWDLDELLMADDCFHLAIISPAVQTGGKPNLIIHVVPAAVKGWTELREHDYQHYLAEKARIADFYINKVQQYMIPHLRDHILFVDVSSPATYARYLGSPTGSNFDMLPVPRNFGKNRLPTRTPIENLFLPKFSHGLWPSLQAGLQVVDMISNRQVMGGNASFSPDHAQLARLKKRGAEKF